MIKVVGLGVQNGDLSLRGAEAIEGACGCCKNCTHQYIQVFY